MRIKRSIIPFLPIALAMIGLRLFSIFGADDAGNVFGMDRITVSYAVVGLALLIFLVSVVINIFDRKTAPVYEVKRNIFAGVFAALSGVLIVGNSLLSFAHTSTETDYYLMSAICAFVSLPAALALIFISRVHFTGNTTVSGLSFLYIFPAIWGCTELVYEFLLATKISVSSSDMTMLFCYVFLTLYLFSNSMIVSRIKGRNPVKACFIYGLPVAALCLSFGAYNMAVSLSEGLSGSVLVLSIMLLSIGCYTVSFLFEMSRGTLTKDEVEILDQLPDNEDEDGDGEEYVDTGDIEELVFSARSNEDESEEDAPYMSNPESLEDFIMGYESNEDEEPIPYLTKNEMEKDGVDGYIVDGGAGLTPAEYLRSAFGPDDLPQNVEVDEVPEDSVEPALAEDIGIVGRRDTPAKASQVSKSMSDIDALLKELESKK